MAYGRFEKDHEPLKYRCPAEHYGSCCVGEDNCPAIQALRVLLEEDRRILTPLARSNYKWQDCYKMRTATERANSRLDVSFGFENHYIYGLKRMKLRVGLTLSVMSILAVGRIKSGQAEKMHSLVTAA